MSSDFIQPTHFWPDKHEAKELRGLLDRLAPADRIKWLRIVCLKVSGPWGRTDVTASTGETREVLSDFWSLAGSRPGLLEWATVGAEAMVKQKDLREMFARSIRG